jgi:hypothetical protein
MGLSADRNAREMEKVDVSLVLGFGCVFTL